MLVSRDVELKALAEARDFLSRELGGIEIRIEKEEEGTSPRKSNALPGKPAIYVSK